MTDEYLTDGKTDTARAAGESIRDHIARLEGMVLACVRSRGIYGVTCAEAEVLLGLIHQTASPRFTSLRDRKFIRDSGMRRMTPSNRKAIVWVIW